MKPDDETRCYCGHRFGQHVTSYWVRGNVPGKGHWEPLRKEAWHCAWCKCLAFIEPPASWQPPHDDTPEF